MCLVIYENVKCIVNNILAVEGMLANTKYKYLGTTIESLGPEI